jgi:hypothetical protein
MTKEDNAMSNYYRTTLETPEEKKTGLTSIQQDVIVTFSSLIEQRIKVYTNLNNNGSQMGEKWCKAQDKKMDKMYTREQELMTGWGITLDYPGLYPCYNFTHNGKSYQELSLVNAFRRINGFYD